MSKRKPVLTVIMTPANVHSRIRRRACQAEGKDYRPFYNIKDFPLSNICTIMPGIKIKRSFQYQSELERDYHILCEFSTFVTDIREHYALLPWEETQEIAAELKIRHPVYPRTKLPIVLSSDIVLTINRHGYPKHAILCIKPSAVLDPENPKSKRILERLYIEKTYWSRRNVPWKVFTEDNIPITRLRNLAMLRHPALHLHLDKQLRYMDHFVTAFKEHWKAEYCLNSILDKLSGVVGVDRGDCFRLFRSLLLNFIRYFKVMKTVPEEIKKISTIG